MPRVPKYRRRGNGKYARVTIDGKDIHLGLYGTQESLDKYAEVIAKWRGDDWPNGQSDECSDNNAIEAEPTACLICELVAEYAEHSLTYYGNTGGKRGTANNERPTFRDLVELFGDLPAALFSPLKLKKLQQHWIEKGNSRGYVNKRTGVIKRCFKWGVAQELIPASVYQALACVANLKAGRTPARETKSIECVDDADVEATLQHAPHEQLVVMVRIQRLTGMRPGEVCQLRPCDIDRSAGDVWLFSPAKHKTQHRGKRRIVAIGPRAQTLLKPYLLRLPAEYCFRPSDATYDHRVGDRYTNDSYRQMVHRACDRAGIPRWNPNQLRHTAATEVRRKFDLESAQTVLGHAKSDMTEHYAEKNLLLAQQVAREIG